MKVLPHLQMKWFRFLKKNQRWYRNHHAPVLGSRIPPWLPKAIHIFRWGEEKKINKNERKCSLPKHCFISSFFSSNQRLSRQKNATGYCPKTAVLNSTVLQGWGSLAAPGPQWSLLQLMGRTAMHGNTDPRHRDQASLYILMPACWNVGI